MLMRKSLLRRWQCSDVATSALFASLTLATVACGWTVIVTGRSMLRRGDIYDAETIEGIFGVDDEEWEASVNERFADYGFRLGGFDEEC